ncbi:ATP-binding cassette domain-containing protein [Clostridium sp. SHJSY1]|uniref:energy-coupling factor ABC transporter ATP-binding protein n=1 Tax=Clostridium sp. SHJSY1 TaxID=2942483 RepID=UPI002874C24C|nr:ATP-binding cassette domain-containing protein [Clostridium sp. SHJSY1]MDS0528209.1 ATP-binding cassette domain-containing protein [Clostridium sp. SHJSY1]
MDNVIIKTEHLCYTYEDGSKALKDVNIEISKGEKIAVMGSNGSGKSTFFLCLNGIHKPESGSLFFNNSPINYSRKGLLDLRSKVGIVFQDPDNQLFSANIFQEISFGLLNLGINEEEARLKVENIIEDLDIHPFRSKPTHNLSGGQKKQVSIADILVMEPEVILLDEPASALDPKHTDMIYGIINKLSDKGITVIISTHDVDHAFKWADTVVLFHKGTILRKDTPEDIFKDKELLLKTNLKKPVILELFENLCSKNILDSSLPVPKTLETLQSYIENIN